MSSWKLHNSELLDSFLSSAWYGNRRQPNLEFPVIYSG